MSQENPMDNNKEELLKKEAELKEAIRKETEALEKSDASAGETLPAKMEISPEQLQRWNPNTSMELEIQPVVTQESTPIEPKEKPIKSERTIKAEKEAAKESSDFIAEFNLTPLLPEDFKDLDDAQKLKIIRDLKRRIVDIVKADGQTQYSEFTKKKTAEMVKPDANIIKRGALTALDTVMQSLSKESNLKKIEGKVFNDLTGTPEGRALIAEDLNRLTKMTKNRIVGISEEGNPAILYINAVNTRDMLNITKEEEKTFDIFNQRAFIFTKMPYEWGQEEGGKHRKEFDEAAEKYAESRNEVLKIKEGREALRIQSGEIVPAAKGTAILDMLEIDNVIQMEQLLNTHPEFESMLADFGEGAGGKEVVKTAGNFLQTITGGKNLTNKMLTAGGFAARMAAKGAAVFTGATMCTALGAPVIGGTIGYFRGKFRAKDTLTEREKGARHGQEDESKEATNTVDAENLNKRLETIIRAFENAPETFDITPDGIKILGKEERRDQIARRIQYTQEKIENGLVNFGDAKTALANQYNLINNLNRAAVIAASLEESTNKELDARLKQFLEYKGEKIDTAQSEFIKKQAIRGMWMGATAGAAGYAVRWFGESVGWFGHHAPTATGKPSLQHFDKEGRAILDLKQPKTPGLPADYDRLSQTPTHNAPDYIEPIKSPVPSSLSITGQEGEGPLLELHESSITFTHGKGAIQGILDLKAQIRHDYPDISKAPQSVQDFMHTDATKEAIKLGLFHPGATDGNESALVGEGSVLKLDIHGNISLHDTLNGKDSILVHGDSAEVEHYGGKMFHSGHENHKVVTGIKTETPEPENIPKAPVAPLENAPEQDYTTGPEQNAGGDLDAFGRPKISGVDEAREKVLANFQTSRYDNTGTLIQDNQGHPIEHLKQSLSEIAVPKEHIGINTQNGIHLINTHELTPHEVSERIGTILRNNPEFAHNPSHLTTERLVKAYDVGQEKINQVIQHNHFGSTGWRTMKDLKVSKLVGNKNFDSNNPMIQYLNKLQDTTGLKPRGWSLFHRAETVNEYIAKAIQKAAKISKLSEIEAWEPK